MIPCLSYACVACLQGQACLQLCCIRICQDCRRFTSWAVTRSFWHPITSASPCACHVRSLQFAQHIILLVICCVSQWMHISCYIMRSQEAPSER